ncbi:MAG: 2-oxo acid dehydrogenase subunit E2 [Defluviitaleaceae bacterium]|nr:2-oxo acid dehydrogenase subunit E2 [Defluviitaleaceae bacterium]MCL2275598.1 2-oxo acid dehydrogenase subunit E2 [Defluviitaleaceae bacterium]
MATGILMPKAGISVESCIMGTWHKNVGDAVKAGDVLFDYETDKAAFECEATADGHLIDIFFESGDEVPCLTVVGAVGNPGEDVSALKPSQTEAKPVEKNEAIQITLPRDNESAPMISSAPAAGFSISPRARKLAAQMRVDTRGITPGGPRGRIIERDIIEAAQQMKTGENIGGRGNDGFYSGGAGIRSTLHAHPKGEPYTDAKMSPIRKAIAKSMVKSLSEIAQLTHQHSCDATVALALRRRFKDADIGLEGVTINDLVLFAVVKTLQKHPEFNAHLINGDTLRTFTGVHLGLAVDTPRGLLVPTIFDADQMGLIDLSNAVKEVAGLAKTGNISPDLLQGATFTVSNLGATGVEMFTPVINPPQVAILGVCGLTPRVCEVNGAVSVYQSMGLSLTYDHRAIDGAPASRFAQSLSKTIENIDLHLII